MPEPASARVFGWREVLIAGAIIVGIVLGLSLLTDVLPISAQWIVYQSPLFIVVIIVGTVLVLASLIRRPRSR